MNSAALPSIAQTLANLELVDRDDAVRLAEANPGPRDFIRAAFDNGLISSEDLSKELSTRFGTPLFDISTLNKDCLLYTSPSPRDKRQSRMPSSA